MKKKTSKISIALAVILATASAVTPAYAAVTYPDINGHWSKNIVEKWAEANVVSGYPDGTFKPNENISRAEFAVWVYKLFGYQPSSKESNFNDISGHWAESIIDSLVEHGVIVNAEYGDSYEPDTKITRMEMIRMMVRAIEKQGETDGAVGATKFIDNAAILHKDTGYINVAAKYDIIAGYPDGSLKPYAKSTRAEGAAMLVKLQKISEELPAEEPKQEEVKEPSSGGGGGSSKVRPATIDFTLADTTYVADKEPVVATVSGATEVEWKLLKDGVQVDMNTYATAALTQNGGEITFKEPGDYELVGIAKNRRGVETTASKKISVYHKFKIEMPAAVKKDKEVTASVIAKDMEDMDDKDIKWSVEKDGKIIDISSVISDDSDKTEPKFKFEESGDYVIKVSVTDEDGNTTSASHTIKVFEPIVLHLDMPDTAELYDDIAATLTTENLGTANVEWIITRNGQTIDIADIAAETPDNEGAAFSFDIGGNYAITVKAIDPAGDEVTDTHTIGVSSRISIPLHSTHQVGESIPLTLNCYPEVSFDTAQLVDIEVQSNLDEDCTDYSIVEKGYTSRQAYYEITFNSPGRYIITFNWIDGYGNALKGSTEIDVISDSAPDIQSYLPKQMYTDSPLIYETWDKNLYGYHIQWSVYDENNNQLDWDTYMDGLQSVEARRDFVFPMKFIWKFKKTGVYKLGATATTSIHQYNCDDYEYSAGKNLKYEYFSDFCKVYQTYDFDIVLHPEEIWTDNLSLDALNCSITGNADGISNEMIWTISIDDDSAALDNQDEIEALIKKHGAGEYTVTCSYTDELGRTFSDSVGLKVREGSPDSYLETAADDVE